MKRSVQKGWLYAIAALVILLLVLSPASAGSKTTGSLTGITPAHLSIEPIKEGHATAHLAEVSGTASVTTAPALDWKYAITWDGEFWGRAAIPAPDGGYVIVGESRLGGTEDSAQGAAVAITEPAPPELPDFKFGWLYGYEPGFDTYNDVAAFDNGYVFVGASRNGNAFPVPDAWLMHTDLTGWGSSTDYWQRYYPYDYGPNIDEFNAVVTTSFGGFAAAGITGSYHPDSGNDAFLIQIDGAGTTTGSGAYDGTVPKTAESIRQTSDGGYILAGSTMPSSSSETRVLLIRLNPDLSVRWERTFGNNPENGAFDVRQTKDGGFIVAGYTRDDADHRSIYLIRTDSEGKALFEVTPGSGLSSCEGRGVVQTSDGGFVVTGPSSGVYVAKVDDSGSTVWEQVYLSQYPQSDVASIEQTSDGGFLIGGTRLEPGELAAFQIMKLGPEIAVPQPLPLPGLSAVPTDPDGDGLYEDLNGNSAADFNDVVLFFTYLEWIGENEPISLFDFNVNGQVDFADITLLFEEL